MSFIKNVFYISGFYDAKDSKEENKMIKLLEQNQYNVFRTDYYVYYKEGSQKVIESVVNDLISFYYSENEPIDIWAWSLGGAILSEVLKLIEILNELIENEEARIRIRKIKLFSPGFSLIDKGNLLKSWFGRLDFETEQNKRLNKKNVNESVRYAFKNPASIKNVFNISKRSRSNLDVFSHYDTTCYIPENDVYTNINNLGKLLDRYEIKKEFIGSYGHAAPLDLDFIKRIINEDINLPKL